MDRLEVPSITEADQLRAKELGRMDAEQRNALFEDIHGVGGNQPTSDDFLRLKLDEFHRALDRIPDKAAYNKARLMDATYVNDRKLHLMAIRAEEYDVLKAARRYANHYDFKLELFGLDKLAKDITFDDLDDDDRETIDAGFFQILPQPDSVGRQVIVMAQEYQRFATYKSLLRMVWYFAMKCYAEENTMRKGCSIVMYNVALTKPTELYREQMKYGSRHLKSMLGRMSAIHYCYDNPLLQPAMAVFQIILGRSVRLRFCAHFGSHLECRYKLASYGIPINCFPIELDGSLLTANHQRIMAKMADEEREEIRRRMADPNFRDRIYVTSRDVLFGRGRVVLGFPGNQKLSEAIAEYYAVYNEASRSKRTEISNCIVNYIQSPAVGGRFLTKRKDEPDLWKIVPNGKARDKVGHAFRNFRQGQKKGAVLCAPGTGQNSDNSDGSVTDDNSSIPSKGAQIVVSPTTLKESSNDNDDDMDVEEML